MIYTYDFVDELRDKVIFLYGRQHNMDVLGCMYKCVLEELVYDYTNTCTGCMNKSKYKLIWKMIKCME